jgi:hypothetical protein
MVNSRDKGIRAELDLARFLRDHGYPDAERSVRAGFNNGLRKSPDEGDIRGTPYTWQIKHYAGGLSHTEVDSFLADAEQQSIAARTVMAVLVERVERKPVELWVCHITAAALAEQLGATNTNPFVSGVPVSLRLGDLLPILRAAATAS